MASEEERCIRCDGTGEYEDGRKCGRCGGDGIEFDIAEEATEEAARIDLELTGYRGGGLMGRRRGEQAKGVVPPETERWTMLVGELVDDVWVLPEGDDGSDVPEEYRRVEVVPAVLLVAERARADAAENEALGLADERDALKEALAEIARWHPKTVHVQIAEAALDPSARASSPDAAVECSSTEDRSAVLDEVVGGGEPRE
jgi:hypothetical protein